MDLDALLNGRATNRRQPNGVTAAAASSAKAAAAKILESSASAIFEASPPLSVLSTVAKAETAVSLASSVVRKAAGGGQIPDQGRAFEEIPSLAGLEAREVLAILQRDIQAITGESGTVPHPARKTALSRLSRSLLGLDLTLPSLYEADKDPQASFHPLAHLFAWLLAPADYECDAVPAGIVALCEACSRVQAWQAHKSAEGAAAQGEREDEDDERGGSSDVDPSDDEDEDNDAPATRGAIARRGALMGVVEEEGEGESEEADEDAKESRRKAQSKRRTQALRAQQASWQALHILASLIPSLVPPLLARACDAASETIRLAATRLLTAALTVSIAVNSNAGSNSGGSDEAMFVATKGFAYMSASEAVTTIMPMLLRERAKASWVLDPEQQLFAADEASLDAYKRGRVLDSHQGVLKVSGSGEGNNASGSRAAGEDVEGAAAASSGTAAFSTGGVGAATSFLVEPAGDVRLALGRLAHAAFLAACTVAQKALSAGGSPNPVPVSLAGAAGSALAVSVIGAQAHGTNLLPGLPYPFNAGFGVGDAHTPLRTCIDAFWVDILLLAHGLAVDGALETVGGAGGGGGSAAYAESKISGCAILTSAALLAPSVIRFLAVALVRSLASCTLGHRLARVRLACLAAVETLVAVTDPAKGRGSGSEAILTLLGGRDANVLPITAFYRYDPSINHLAKLMFDSNAQVRRRFATMLGVWMCCLEDRHEWWNRLLPYLMTALHDDTIAAAAPPPSTPSTGAAAEVSTATTTESQDLVAFPSLPVFRAALVRPTVPLPLASLRARGGSNPNETVAGEHRAHTSPSSCLAVLDRACAAINSDGDVGNLPSASPSPSPSPVPVGLAAALGHYAVAHVAATSTAASSIQPVWPVGHPGPAFVGFRQRERERELELAAPMATAGSTSAKAPASLFPTVTEGTSASTTSSAGGLSSAFALAAACTKPFSPASVVANTSVITTPQLALSILEACGLEHESLHADVVLRYLQTGIDGDPEVELSGAYDRPLPPPFNYYHHGRHSQLSAFGRGSKQRGSGRPRLGMRLFVRTHAPRYMKAVLGQLHEFTPFGNNLAIEKKRPDGKGLLNSPEAVDAAAAKALAALRGQQKEGSASAKPASIAAATASGVDVSPRVRAAQLLCSTLALQEDSATADVHLLVPALVSLIHDGGARGSNNDDADATWTQGAAAPLFPLAGTSMMMIAPDSLDAYITAAARLTGRFISPSAYLPLLLPYVRSDPVVIGEARLGAEGSHAISSAALHVLWLALSESSGVHLQFGQVKSFAVDGGMAGIARVLPLIPAVIGPGGEGNAKILQALTLVAASAGAQKNDEVSIPVPASSKAAEPLRQWKLSSRERMRNAVSALASGGGLSSPSLLTDLLASTVLETTSAAFEAGEKQRLEAEKKEAERKAKDAEAEAAREARKGGAARKQRDGGEESLEQSVSPSARAPASRPIVEREHPEWTRIIGRLAPWLPMSEVRSHGARGEAVSAPPILGPGGHAAAASGSDAPVVLLKRHTTLAQERLPHHHALLRRHWLRASYVSLRILQAASASRGGNAQQPSSSSSTAGGGSGGVIVPFGTSSGKGKLAADAELSGADHLRRQIASSVRHEVQVLAALILQHNGGGLSGLAEKDRETEQQAKEAAREDLQALLKALLTLKGMQGQENAPLQLQQVESRHNHPQQALSASCVEALGHGWWTANGGSVAFEEGADACVSSTVAAVRSLFSNTCVSLASERKAALVAPPLLPLDEAIITCVDQYPGLDGDAIALETLWTGPSACRAHAMLSCLLSQSLLPSASSLLEEALVSSCEATGEDGDSAPILLTILQDFGAAVLSTVKAASTNDGRSPAALPSLQSVSRSPSSATRLLLAWLSDVAIPALSASLYALGRVQSIRPSSTGASSEELAASKKAASDACVDFASHLLQEQVMPALCGTIDAPGSSSAEFEAGASSLLVPVILERGGKPSAASIGQLPLLSSMLVRERLSAAGLMVLEGWSRAIVSGIALLMRRPSSDASPASDSLRKVCLHTAVCLLLLSAGTHFVDTIFQAVDSLLQLALSLPSTSEEASLMTSLAAAASFLLCNKLMTPVIAHSGNVAAKAGRVFSSLRSALSILWTSASPRNCACGTVAAATVYAVGCLLAAMPALGEAEHQETEWTTQQQQQEGRSEGHGAVNISESGNGTFTFSVSSPTEDETPDTGSPGLGLEDERLTTLQSEALGLAFELAAGAHCTDAASTASAETVAFIKLSKQACLRALLRSSQGWLSELEGHAAAATASGAAGSAAARNEGTRLAEAVSASYLTAISDLKTTDELFAPGADDSGKAAALVPFPLSRVDSSNEPASDSNDKLLRCYRHHITSLVEHVELLLTLTSPKKDE